jgi:hypothetical protein
MPKIDLRAVGTAEVAVPLYASAADCDLAEVLRRRLEERFLAPPAAPHADPAPKPTDLN